MSQYEREDEAQRAHNSLQGALIILGAAPTVEMSAAALVLAARIHIKVGSAIASKNKEVWMDRCARMWDAEWQWQQEQKT